MATFLISFLVIALCVLGLAIGVIAGRAPLKGSCGGLNNCSCSNPCERKQQQIRLGLRD